jgi:hypothetical protein
LIHRAGRLSAINDFLSALPTQTSDTGMDYKKITLGIETISILSASDVPGVLMQVNILLKNRQFFAKIHDISLRAQISLALGDYSSDKLPLATTKKVQKAITLFFSVCRGTVYDETTEAGIKVHFSV